MVGSQPDQPLEGAALYDRIGVGYRAMRRTDPRIASRIWAALGDAPTIVNVGAGTDSYEPADRAVTAVEPSEVMRSQRPPGAARCVPASAEELPFAGLRGMQRVARRVVVFQFDNQQFLRFWLIRDYLPEAEALARRWPTLAQRAAAIGARMEPVPIPWDCIDSFFHACWRRPEMYLQEQVRRATSVWARLGPSVEERAVRALRADLESGLWHERNRKLLDLVEADFGARLLIADAGESR